MKSLTIALTASLLAGCVAIPYTREPVGPVTQVLETISPSCRGDSGHIVSSHCIAELKAVYIEQHGGMPVYTDKIGIGFFPSIELYESSDLITSFNILLDYAILPIIPYFGVPYLDALLYEPFQSQPETEGGTYRSLSPVGFCKYRIGKRTKLLLTGYSVSYKGQVYYANARGEILIPFEWRYQESFTVRLLTVPKGPNGENIEQLKDFVGTDFTFVCK